MWNNFNHNDNADNDSRSSGQYYVNSNIDTDYDGYQQAWRVLGIYVDCSNYISASNNNADRGCQRYLIWASYIDLQYQGGAIGEYQHYNTTTRSYDDSTCVVATNNQRCAKMDCHETASDTWSLLGIYKEPYYASQFFEQLFKHMGYCVWDSNTYTFMQNSYAMWPDNTGCVASTTTNPVTNQPYYIDLKPGPILTLGIYTDSMCYHEYVESDDTTDAVNADTILQNSGFLSSEQVQQFNDAMMLFQICQPCRAYNLDNADGLLYNNGNDNNDNNNNAYTYNDPNYPKYSCYDVAGYTNVNQCMKFRTHTEMMHMTRKDIHVATLQGAITNLQFYTNTNPNSTARQQQFKTATTLSSSYQSVYFHASLNESDTLQISNAGAYAALSVAIFFTIGTIYYCCVVFMWVRKKNRKQRPV